MHAALALVLLFAWQLAASGMLTAWLILRPGKRPSPLLVRFRYGRLTDIGAAILGGMITLTPGSTLIDIDSARKELLVHMLDGSDPAGAVAGIRARFERHLEVLFPRRES